MSTETEKPFDVLACLRQCEDACASVGDRIGYNRFKAAADAFEQQSAEIARLKEMVKDGRDTVLDFLPNVGRCALQDYGRLNRFLMDSEKALSALPGEKQS